MLSQTNKYLLFPEQILSINIKTLNRDIPYSPDSNYERLMKISKVCYNISLDYYYNKSILKHN